MAGGAAPGKRAGSRRGAKAPRRLSLRLLVLALGITLSVIAWGYLVFAAIDFGSSARDGRRIAWAFLALASVGAVACLFVALVLIGRLVGSLRTGSRPDVGDVDPTRPTGSPPSPLDPPRLPGGRRAAR